MTRQFELFAKANLYEELMERASEVRTILMVMRNMFIKLANDNDKMSLERSDKQISAIEDMLPTAFIECLHRCGEHPREGATNSGGGDQQQVPRPKAANERTRD